MLLSQSYPHILRTLFNCEKTVPAFCQRFLLIWINHACQHLSMHLDLRVYVYNLIFKAIYYQILTLLVILYFQFLFLLLWFSYLSCIRVRHLLSLSVLFIHGWHPQMKKSAIIFSMYDKWKSFHPWMEFSFAIFLGKNQKKSIIPRSRCRKNLIWKYDVWNFEIFMQIILHKV